MSTEARFDAIGIVVSDMAKALAFYRQAGPGRARVGRTDRGTSRSGSPGGVRLLWDTEEDDPLLRPRLDARRGAAGLNCRLAMLGTPPRSTRTYAGLLDAGYEGHLAPWDAFWGQRYASVRDPDGNGVDLFAPL